MRKMCATKNAPRNKRTLSVRVRRPKHAALPTRPALEMSHPLSIAFKSPFLSSKALSSNKVVQSVLAQSVDLRP